jgi:glutamyl endopeptidase
MGLEDSKIGEEPMGLEDSKIGEEPMGLEDSKIAEEPIGLEESKIGEEPTGLEESKIAEEPIGLEGIKIGEEPTGLEESKIGEEPTGLEESKIAKEFMEAVKLKGAGLVNWIASHFKIKESPIESPCQKLLECFGGPVDAFRNETYDSIDDIEKIMDQSCKFPFSALGMLYYQMGNTVKQGSGAIIGPNLVLTCANIFYENNQKYDTSNMTFIPGFDGRNKPFGELRIKEVHYPEEYPIRGGEDYALIVLYETIGDKTGYFGVKQYKKRGSKGDIGYIYGYPIEKKGLHGMGVPFKVDDNRNMISYKIDTSEGHSGSPLYIKENEKYLIIGIHVQGYNEEILQDELNKAVYLSNSRIRRIKGWIMDYYTRCNTLKEIDSTSIEKTYKKLNDLGNQPIILSNLKYLTLRRAFLKAKDAKILANINLLSLRILDLSENQILKKGALALSRAKLPNLKNLNLGNNEIGNDGAIFIFKAQFQNLTTLSLFGNQIGNYGIKELPNAIFIQKLIKLDLSDNCVTYGGAKAVSKSDFQRLSTLDLSGNKIPHNRFKELRAKLPRFIHLNFDNTLKLV